MEVFQILNDLSRPNTSAICNPWADKRQLSSSKHSKFRYVPAIDLCAQKVYSCKWMTKVNSAAILLRCNKPGLQQAVFNAMCLAHKVWNFMQLWARSKKKLFMILSNMPQIPTNVIIALSLTLCYAICYGYTRIVQMGLQTHEVLVK